MNKQPGDKIDTRTDAERFLDTVRQVVSAKKADVDESIKQERQERKAKKAPLHTA